MSTEPHSLGEPGLLRLLQLASATLPVGGFAFSQGLEQLVEAGAVPDEAATGRALEAQLRHQLGRVDLPILLRAHRAAAADARAELGALSDLALACRETRELHLTDTAMGGALLRLFGDLEGTTPVELTRRPSFPVAFGFAAARWGVPASAAALGLGWSWLENQVAAATRLVPLGQTAAQRLLGALGPALIEAKRRAEALSDDDIGGTLPGLAIASARHETQHTRLFRS